MVDDPSFMVERFGDPTEGSYVPPQADHFRVIFCDACPNAHILLYDEHGRGIAQFILTADQAAKIVLSFVEAKDDQE